MLGRLHAVPAHGYGYVHGEIRDPLLDNSAHMARMFERYLREFREHTADPALADRIAAHASAFAACPRPAYCHGDMHQPNPLVSYSPKKLGFF